MRFDILTWGLGPHSHLIDPPLKIDSRWTILLFGLRFITKDPRLSITVDECRMMPPERPELAEEKHRPLFGVTSSGLTDLLKVECSFQCPTMVEVEEPAGRAHPYRIAQEAVTNSRKHERATRT